jgi:hypothetical protein
MHPLVVLASLLTFFILAFATAPKVRTQDKAHHLYHQGDYQQRPGYEHLFLLVCPSSDKESQNRLWKRGSGASVG